MDEIRIGLVGLGHRGLHWLRLLQRIKGYRVTAICDQFVPLHEPALATLGSNAGVAVYSEYEELLADQNVDAVAIVVRSKNQGALAAQALEAGKHVSAEVPAAYTLEDCWRIVSAVERTGLVYLLAEQFQYAGFVEAWRDLVQQGRLGRVTYCEGEYRDYKGTHRYHQDWGTGEFVDVGDLAAHPNARQTWFVPDPIYYLPHALGPMLKVLDDRVVEVTAMSTASPSYSHPEISAPDVQVALMKTEKDAILRMMCSFTQPTPPARQDHWYQIIGTRGCLELERSGRDRPKMWLADAQMHDMAEVDWRRQRTDAPPEAVGSGHGGNDYYVHTAFRDAVLGVNPLEMDVYDAVETAAPAILAVDSIGKGSVPLVVPDFRPNQSRAPGQMPTPDKGKDGAMR